MAAHEKVFAECRFDIAHACLEPQGFLVVVHNLSLIHILDFCVDNIDYRIVRQIKSFAVFKGEELILVTSKVMSELAPLLEKIFHFGIYLDSKKDGRVTLAPPVFTFLPYYIDQVMLL